MPVKKNEITVKLNSSKENFIKLLIEKNFKLEEEQFLEDFYFIPSHLDIKNNSVRNILSYAILVRTLYNKTKSICKSCKLCHKIKQFNDNGDIINQCIYDVDINNSEDAKSFLKAIGYTQILKIDEYEYHLVKDGLTLEIKDVVSGELYMEIETNKKFDNVEKLKAYLKELNLPIDESNYFIKKAEIELEKVINKL